MRTGLLLLDTDILSLIGRRKPPPGLRPWLLRIGIHRLAISFPLITELMRGAHLVEEEDPEKADRIKSWVRQILSTDFTILEMSPDVADLYARMTCKPCLRHMWTIQRHEKHNRLGHDLMFAAVAIAYEVPILTANISHFLEIHGHFPLPGLHQPMEARWYVAPRFPVSLPHYDPNEPDPDEARLPGIQ